MLTTDEIVREYKSIEGVKRRLTVTHNHPGYTYKRRESKYGGYIHPFGVDEKHTDRNGDNWYIISAFTFSLDKWLEAQCETNYKFCGHAYPHPKWDAYPRYDIHESLLFYIQLKWT